MVLDEQDPQASFRRRRSGRICRWESRLDTILWGFGARHNRQLDREHRAFVTALAEGLDPAGVQFDELLRNGQAQPQPAEPVSSAIADPVRVRKRRE